MSHPPKHPNPIRTNPKHPECWFWAGSLDAYGHPICSMKGKTVRVRQLHFMLTFGYTPNRLENSCGNKVCVNPAHLKDIKRVKKDQNFQTELAKVQERLDYLTSAIGSIEPIDTLTKESIDWFKQEQEKYLARKKELEDVLAFSESKNPLQELKMEGEKDGTQSP